MKKVLAIFIATLLCLTLAACTAGQPTQFTPTIPLPGEEGESAAPVALEPLPKAGLANPFTGQPLAEGGAEGQRPVAVIVANDLQSLPQRGLAASDVLIEAPNERGTTTMMALYGDSRAVPQVGPVRDVNDQLLQFALPSSAIIAHIGGTLYAKNLLNVLAYQDVNGEYLGTTCFSYDVARRTAAGGDKRNENNWFTDGNLIMAGAGIVGINPLGEVNQFFRFAEGDRPLGESAYDVIAYFKEDYVAAFHYDPTLNQYLMARNTGAQADEDGTPVYRSNVLLLGVNIGLKADGVFPEFDLTGGAGLYYNGGQGYNIQWRKGGPTEPLRLFGPDGAELLLQKSNTYIGLLPAGQLGLTSSVDKTTREQLAAEAAAAQAAAESAAAAEAAAAQAAADQAAAEAAAAAAAASAGGAAPPATSAPAPPA